VVKKSSVIDELLTENYGAIKTELWEKALENEIKKTQKNKNIHTWFGLITPNDLSSLRTKYRLEELQRIQKDFVTFLNPGKHGIPGYIGFNSDYVYAFLIQSKSENIVQDWMDSIRAKLAHGLKLSAGGTLNISFKAGVTKISTEDENAYQVLTKAKKALSEVLKNEEIEFFEV
jgi:hypothetical protein